MADSLEPNVFSYHPLANFYSGLELGYEVLSKSRKGSFKISVGYHTKTDPKNTYKFADKFTGLRVLLSMRKYLAMTTEKDIRVFFGPYFLFKTIELTPYTGSDKGRIQDGFKKTTATAYGPGVMLGLQTYITKGLLAEIFFGTGMILSTDKEEDIRNVHKAVFYPFTQGIGAQLGVGIGYNF